MIYNVLVSGVQQIASVMHIHMSACMLSHVCLILTPWTVATRFLCPWNFPGKNTGMGCHLLLQNIFLTQELNLCLLCLLHWQADSLPLCHLGSLHVHISTLLLPSIPFCLVVCNTLMIPSLTNYMHFDICLFF